ncbi:putative toxin-antitoxin system toxin component, PIN family [Candidatus Poribacteria bacterium]|nr:putative toxin-antitoxin system toxin component, PIN family [Candidatus Poribacteria bacterium]
MPQQTEPYQIVVDTNVLYSGLRSQGGASYQFLLRLNHPKWQVNLSVALVLEYEAVLTQHQREVGLTQKDINDLLDGLCAIARLHGIFYSWRPQSRAPDDDFLIDLSVRAGADFIISYNQKDLQPAAARFGIGVVTPKQFLQQMGELQ